MKTFERGYGRKEHDMEKIGAWIYDPKNALFKGSSKHISLFVLTCERPLECDLFQKEGTCLNAGILSGCRFGRKTQTEGPTRAAQSFSSTKQKWQTDHADVMGRLKSLTAYNRIFRTHDHYYLPYSHMSKGWFGEGSPLESQWVPVADMTTELLARICSAQPRAMMGGVIPSYQHEQVPKFLADLKAFYPDVFDILPEAQKARLATVSYVGRTADITTCAPGAYRFSNNEWRWDGELLHGKDMLFAPAKGEITITVRPVAGSPVKITDGSQVTDGTRFLD